MKKEIFYKVKLPSGRILGPLTRDRIRLFVQRNHILGQEQAREYPHGEWKGIGQIPELASLLVEQLQGQQPSGAEPGQSKPSPSDALPPTVVASPLSPLVKPAGPQAPLLEPSVPTGVLPGAEGALPLPPVTHEIERNTTHSNTLIAPVREKGNEDHTQIEPKLEESHLLPVEAAPPRIEAEKFPVAEPHEWREISSESTIVLDTTALRKKRPLNVAKKTAGNSKRILMLGVLAFIAYEFLATDDGMHPGARTAIEELVKTRPLEVRPALPAESQADPDPAASAKLYQEGLQFYVVDNLGGYRLAVDRFKRSIRADRYNVQALALLASTYLNLIDASNKDERYFAVISKLIEMSKAKSIDLPETVIAEVEFFIVTNRPEAAQNRIVEFTKLQQTPVGREMYYYLALALYHRGDIRGAAKYLSQIPDNKAFSPRVFYLRGKLAESVGDLDQALDAYQRAVKLHAQHATSHLRIVEVLYRQGKLKSATEHIQFLLKNTAFLSDRDLALAYYLAAQYHLLIGKPDLALAHMERATVLDRENHDFLLELYTLRGKGKEGSKSKRLARMYFYLTEGERHLKSGSYQDALASFLQARESHLDSVIPLEKIGDLWMYLNDFSKARLNYQMAIEQGTQDLGIMSKYVKVLILTYDWEEALKALSKFKKLAVGRSTIDKLHGDLYASQRRHIEAQTYYRKAMGRETIDPEVYIAYARSLMATQNYKDAPFYFALARRYDPLNMEAIVGTAKSVAASSGPDRGIRLLQDEMQKHGKARAELLAGIAELQMQKGEWNLAQKTLDDAREANLEYAYPWKLQAQIYLNRENERGMLDKALDAYKSYSDRNPSDPTGYIERYKNFIRKREYDHAIAELEKVYAVYPKYPELHYFKGVLYGLMGNAKISIDEFQAELQHNPLNILAMMELGKQYLDQKDPTSALKYFGKAMQVNPSASEPKQMAGYANYLLRNFAGAIALYRAALTLDAGNPLIYKRMGMAYADMGDVVNARNSFRKYIEMEPDAPDKAQFQRFL